MSSKWTTADIDTELTRNIPGLLKPAVDVVWPLFSQSAEMGALPTLRAATDQAAKGGQYYGPDGIGATRGYPKVVQSSKQSHDEAQQQRLWAVSEDLTSVTNPV